MTVRRLSWPRRAREDRTPPWAIAALLALAWPLRQWGLGARSLWTEEGATWVAAIASPAEMIRLCAQKEGSPPLYYALTSFVLGFGSSEAHLRFISMLASLGLVLFTYRLARLVALRREALLAAALTALSPFQLVYAQEARPYALTGLLMVATLYLFARAVLFGKTRSWGPFVVVSALALWCQGIALLGIAVQGVVIGVYGKARKQIVPWSIAVVGSFLLFVPWLIMRRGPLAALGHAAGLPPPTEHFPGHVLRMLFMGPVSLITVPEGTRVPGLDAFLPRGVAQVLLVAIAGLPLMLTLRSALERGTRGMMTRFTAIAVVLPLAIISALFPHTPLWAPRTFVFVTPFLSLLIARGLLAIQHDALRRLWSALVVVVSAYACLRVRLDFTKEPWRDVVRSIAEQAQGRTAAVLVPLQVDPFLYYNAKLPHPLEAYEVSHPKAPFALTYTPQQLDDMERLARARARDRDEVWVVAQEAVSEGRREVERRAERAAADGHPRIERGQWDSTTGPLRVVRCRRAGP